MKKIIRTATVAMSLDLLLKGQLAFLRNHYFVVAVSGQDHHLETVAKREGVQTKAISIQRSISPVKDFISLIQLYFLFRKEKPSIVHSITPKAGLLSMIAAYFAGVPVRIHTFTGLIFPSKKGVVKQLLIFMDRVLCQFATHVYPEGQGVKNDLIAYNITKKPLNIIANGNVNGIDVAYFNPNVVSDSEQMLLKEQLGISTTDFVFVFVGRLVADKGINEMVAAFEALRPFNKLRANETQGDNSGLNCKLLLVGDYETKLDPLLPETLFAIQNNSNIVTVGFQNDVRPYLAISDALVFPSYREGFPNVVMQAGAMGLPAIVSNINGCNEIIKEGQNGTIIPVKNVAAIIEKMELMLTDKSYFKKLQSNARQMIVSRYEQKLVWEAILREYKNLG